MAVELDNKDLKVIRLDNGEILFSKVLVTDTSKSNGYLELHWPMRVLMKFDDGEKVLHWHCLNGYLLLILHLYPWQQDVLCLFQN